MVLRWMEFALKQSQSHAIEESLRRSWKNVCFCHWAPLPYIPGHAEIESPEAQVQKEYEFEPSWQERGGVVQDLVSLLFNKQMC